MKLFALLLVASLFSCELCCYADSASQTESNGKAAPASKEFRKENAKSIERAKRIKDQKDLLDSLKDDDVFFEVVGWDSIKWGELRKIVEGRVSRIKAPPGADMTEVEEVKKRFFISQISKIVRQYSLNSVTAQEAHRLGLDPSEGEIAEMRKQAVDFYKKRNASPEDIASIGVEGSFADRDLRNRTYVKKYYNEVVCTNVVVSADEVSSLMIARHQANLSVAASNELYKAQIRSIYDDVRSGKMTFEEAAEEYSECNSSVEGGVFGSFSKGELRHEMEESYSRLAVGEFGEPVETPYSFHIIKVLGRDEERGTTEIAHIMIEKTFLKPELAEEQARAEVLKRKARAAMKKIQLSLLAKADIKCVVPMTPSKEDAKRRSGIRVIRD